MVAKTTNIVETKLTAKETASSKFNRMRLSADRLRNSLGLTTQNLARLRNTAVIAAAGATLAAAALFKLTSTVSERADEFAKLSRQVGFSIESLQTLEGMAGFQGASYEGIAKGIQTFTKRMGEFRAGTGALATGLDKIDPVLAKQLLATETNQEAYELFIGRISELTDEQAQMALASAGVSKQGAKEIIRVVAGGEKAAEKLARLVRKLRPPFTKKEAKEAEDYNDALFASSLVAKSLSDRLGISLAPVLTKVVKRFTEWVSTNREFINSRISYWVEQLGKWLSGIDFGRVAASAESFASATVSVVSGIGKVIDAVGGVQNATIALIALWTGPKLLSAAIKFRTASIIASGATAAGGAASAAAAGTGAAVGAGAFVAGAASILAAGLAFGFAVESYEKYRKANRTPEEQKRIDDETEKTKIALKEHKERSTNKSGGVNHLGFANQFQEIETQSVNADELAAKVQQAIRDGISGGLDIVVKFIGENVDVTQVSSTKRSKMIGNVGSTVPSHSSAHNF